MILKNIENFILVAVTVMLLSACGTTSMTKAGGGVSEVYEVHHEGRIHVFYDRKLYTDFLKLGETPYRLTRIGAGPNNETLVFGLTKKDKKKRSGIPVVDLFDGKAKPAEDFYAEMVKHGRIYIFNNFDDMKTVRDFGHPNYQYSMIGAGPNGETLVFVLNKQNKKKRPTGLIKKYEQHHS